MKDHKPCVGSMIHVTFHPPERVEAIRFQWVDRSNTPCCCYEIHRLPDEVLESVRSCLRYACDKLMPPVG